MVRYGSIRNLPRGLLKLLAGSIGDLLVLLARQVDAELLLAGVKSWKALAKINRERKTIVNSPLSR